MDLQAIPEVRAEMVFLADQVLQEKTDSPVDPDCQVFIDLGLHK